ncbi:MAG: hypothetical protein M3Q16_06385 [Pseudomonadota bacterium]|nr:hypothetical protein [Pseudomonadota bacterium]
MKPQLPALVMPLSTTETAAQAGSALQGRATLSDGSSGANPTSAADPTVYIDDALHDRARDISSYLQDFAGFKRRISHAALNVRIRKKRFG